MSGENNLITKWTLDRPTDIPSRLLVASGRKTSNPRDEWLHCSFDVAAESVHGLAFLTLPPPRFPEPNEGPLDWLLSAHPIHIRVARLPMSKSPSFSEFVLRASNPPLQTNHSERTGRQFESRVAVMLPPTGLLRQLCRKRIRLHRSRARQ